MLTLRSLDPQTELDLFRESYLWRNKKRSKASPDRMSFEDFSAEAPNKIVMALFNGELCAVYLFREEAPGIFDCHFTSKRRVPKEYVMAGARWMVNWFTEHGCWLSAYVSETNKPLCRFVEEIGFRVIETREFPLQSQNDSGTLRLTTFRHYICS